MTRLIKFNRAGQSIPDYVNPAHIRVIDFDTELAIIQMTGDFSATVTAAEARRLITEINGYPDADATAAADPFAPSPTEIRLNDQAADDILKAALAAAYPYPPKEYVSFSAPAQPFGTGLMPFKAMIQAGDYVVLDTETTGLERGEIVQIAIVESSGAVLLDTLVKPKEPIPADATRIHGITDDMVKDAPTWEAVRRDVFYAIAGRNCVVYNAIYDRKMMHQSAERWGMVKLDWKDYAAFWCAMEAFAEEFGDFNEYRQSYRWQKLSTAAAHYGIEQNEAHTALADCLTTLAVCKAMAGA